MQAQAMSSERVGRGLSTAEVAAQAGVHRDTLLRWLRQGLISEPSRDRHGWRVFSQVQANNIAQFASSGASVVAEGTTADFDGNLSRLDPIDWNFKDAKTSYLSHGLHPYPAKFIPQIPNALIQELSSIGETVCDVFCGSGTTLVEALLLKRNAIGVDANPLACLITRAKTMRLVDGDDELLRDLIVRATALGERLAVAKEPLLFEVEPFVSAASRPTTEAVAFWFPPHVIEELAEILSWCGKLRTESARIVGLAAFSSIVVAVSRQDSDTRYTRREKGIQPGDTCQRFAASLSDVLRGAREFSEVVEERFSAHVINANVLEEPAIEPCDLVVCSPPYPNAYSYHLYHMTRMLWLGMDQPRFKKAEIGSHRKYSRRGPNGASAETFSREMQEVFRWLRKYLRPNRYACFVIGDSIIGGKKVDNTSILVGAAKGAGFVEVKRLHRTLQESRKAFNPAYAKIKTEHILVLRRT